VIGFLLVAILMLLVAMAIVLVPLLRQRRSMTSVTGVAASAAPTDDASNLAIFRAQRVELETDFANGIISADERDAAMRELSVRLAAELDGTQTNAPQTNAAVAVQTKSNPPWLVVGFAAIAIPVAAVMAYATLGTPDALRPQQAAPTARNAAATPGAANDAGAASADAPLSDKQILAMVDSLAQKMEENPADPKGWVLLARSQNALGRFAEAGRAFERAAALTPNDAQLFADYADSAVMAQEGQFKGKPYDLIQKALKLDPNNMKALALAGTAEMRLGNKAASLKHWEKLKTLVPKDSEDSREVDSIIAEVKGAAGPVPAPATVAAPAAAQASTSAPTPAAQARVSGQVTLAPELAGKIAPGDTLFVFARAVNGPKMPLAIVRVPVPKSWPFKFDLDDSMAMAPGMKLSSFPEVTIEARISKAGTAQPQPGDLAGQSAAVKPGASDVGVSISRVLP
jgi:cytochrome c-type biogenesis protein CcmH